MMIAFLFDAVCDQQSRIGVAHYLKQVSKFGDVLAIQVSLLVF